MTPDRVVFAVAWSAGCFVLGMAARGMAQPAPVIEHRRIMPPVQIHQVLSCPVSRHGIEEWHRQCKARARNEEISQGRIK